MKNKEIINLNIEKSKEIVKTNFKKEELIIFFIKSLEKKKNYSKEIRNFFSLLFPYSEIKKQKEIIEKIKNSNLTKSEGLELTYLEEHFIKTEIISKKKINIQEIKKILEYLIKKYFTNTSLNINYLTFCKLLLLAKNSKNVLNMQIEKINSIIFEQNKIAQKEKIKLTKQFLKELKKDIENEN
jgi:hypothetical protein